MRPLTPFRERTPAQLREQAKACRKSARLAGAKEASVLLSVAERYETMAGLKEGADRVVPLAGR